MDKYGTTWLASTPHIKLLSDTNKRKLYRLSRTEQGNLLSLLPNHLYDMALFAVNTGCRDGEMCNLRWNWHARVPELNTTVSIIPSEYVKNGDEMLVVLNTIANDIINKHRGKNAEPAFTYNGTPITRMLNIAWIRSRKSANLEQVRVHNLTHTFGRRLRSASVSFENRQDLLGHRLGRITTHYPAAELSHLLEAANKVCHSNSNSANAEIVILRRLSAS